MIYDIIISPEARIELLSLKKNEPQSYKKAVKLMEELREHPRIGTGHPKPLGENRAGQWSRRITMKHRLIYKINDEQVVVLILSSYGHYGDK